MQSGGIDATDLSVCPSFNLYHSDRLASAVSRAVAEPSTSSPLQSDEFGFQNQEFVKGNAVEDDGDGEFEFEFLCGGSFPEGEIGEIFPIFDRDLVYGGVSGGKKDVAALGVDEVEAASVTLGKLFIEEREFREEDGSSSSSSEADELETVEPGTYCMWKPKAPETPELSPGRCNKSKSTGSSSRRWKLRDLLLRRSNSDGKDSFVFLTPSSSISSSKSDVCEEAKSPSVQKLKAARRSSADHKSSPAAVSAHELFYVKNRAVKEEDRRKSYLPYRKGLVGFGLFPNGMSVTNSFRPF